MAFNYQIAIDIIDINNKLPEAGDFESEIYLYENATTGDLITKVIATDLDRDSKVVISFQVKIIRNLI